MLRVLAALLLFLSIAWAAEVVRLNDVVIILLETD
jgi:hypothetical protein